jgi:hypothetical protein
MPHRNTEQQRSEVSQKRSGKELTHKASNTYADDPAFAPVQTDRLEGQLSLQSSRRLTAYLFAR